MECPPIGLDLDCLSADNRLRQDISATFRSSGLHAHGVSVWPSAQRAYVANYGSDNVSVVDLTLQAEIGTIAPGNGTYDTLESSQVGLRDAEIITSGADCPVVP